jgi:glycerol-3-phosphate O-acyltransferase
MMHAFGGINMNFAGFGYLLRRSGVIFIRRTFQDKPLYKLVLRHYIGYLMAKRFPLTWAFEGTRSRTGKLVPPRYGLLKYVLEGAHDTDARNIHIIPVVLSYDLIRDVEEYATEQSGRVKKPESLKWFIGYMSSLKRPMGRIYMDFGEPVVLEQAPQPDDRLALPKIAFDVAVQANRVTPITLPAVVCMVLLGAAPRALTLAELQAESVAIIRWAARRRIPMSSDFRTESVEHIQMLVEAMEEMGLLMHYDEGSDLVYGIQHDQHPMASYYRNTIVHHFVNKAILELALLRASEAAAQEATTVFWQEALRLRNYFKFEFFYPKKKQFRRELHEEMDRVDTAWEDCLAQGGTAVQALLLDMSPLVAHESLLTFVEAYSVVFRLLARLEPGEKMDQDGCVATALKEGRQAYLQRRITSDASIGKILFQNGYKLAQNLGAKKSGNGKNAGVEATDHLTRLLRDFRDLSRRLERIRLMALSDDYQN